MVVYHSGKKVVGRSDGVEVARKVEVDILHRHYLSVSAAGSSALYSEHGAEGGLSEGDYRSLSDSVKSVSKTYYGSCLSLSGGGGRYGRNKDEFRLVFFVGEFAVIDLCLIISV